MRLRAFAPPVLCAALFLIAVPATASAKVVRGTASADRLNGTSAADTLKGLGGGSTSSTGAAAPTVSTVAPALTRITADGSDRVVAGGGRDRDPRDRHDDRLERRLRRLAATVSRSSPRRGPAPPWKACGGAIDAEADRQGHRPRGKTKIGLEPARRAARHAAAVGAAGLPHHGQDPDLDQRRLERVDRQRRRHGLPHLPQRHPHRHDHGDQLHAHRAVPAGPRTRSA